jgi:ABC-type glycerol-3-phosphate transport system permease component
MMAGTMMVMVPMIVFFLLCQRWFVEGIQIGAVKG